MLETKKKNICLQVTQWFMSCLDKNELSIFSHAPNFHRGVSVSKSEIECVGGVDFSRIQPFKNMVSYYICFSFVVFF